jgi:hypothetical protein
MFFKAARWAQFRSPGDDLPDVEGEQVHYLDQHSFDRPLSDAAALLTRAAAIAAILFLGMRVRRRGDCDGDEA